MSNRNITFDLKPVVELIRYFEGFSATVHATDASGKAHIGYGHVLTSHDYWPSIANNLSPLTLTEEEAEKLLEKDLKYAIRAVLAVADNLYEHQIQALISFVYNIGTSNWKKSTMRRLIVEGHAVRAALEFGRWVYVIDGLSRKKRTLKGLVIRRRAEQAMFQGRSWEEAKNAAERALENVE